MDYRYVIAVIMAAVLVVSVVETLEISTLKTQFQQVQTAAAPIGQVQITAPNAQPASQDALGGLASLPNQVGSC